jgi:3-oxoacyl-[acyl-carrier protein] reductase
MLLKDKTAIITGAALGIGAGIAEVFAAQGAIVYLLDIDENAANDRAAKIAAAGGRAHAFYCDVAKRETIPAAIDHAAAAYGRIDILVNNAGIYPRRAFMDMTEAEWDQMQDVNLKSLFHFCKLVLPHMISRRQGKIVNISSVTFFKGLANLVHYVATKGGMIGFSRALAREIGPHNIHINCVTPGAVKTEGELIHANPDDIAGIVRRQCLNERIMPEHIANVCLFLSSSLSDGMTGQTLNVDGGLILH